MTNIFSRGLKVSRGCAIICETITKQLPSACAGISAKHLTSQDERQLSALAVSSAMQQIENNMTGSDRDEEQDQLTYKSSCHSLSVGVDRNDNSQLCGDPLHDEGGQDLQAKYI